MKTLIGIGIFLTLAGSVLVGNIGESATWIVQSGVILLVGALSIFAGRKRLNSTQRRIWKSVETISFGLMVFLIVWNFLTGAWYDHPLGMLIAITAGIWVFYQGWKSGRSIKGSVVQS